MLSFFGPHSVVSASRAVSTSDSRAELSRSGRPGKPKSNKKKKEKRRRQLANDPNLTSRQTLQIFMPLSSSPKPGLEAAVVVVVVVDGMVVVVVDVDGTVVVVVVDGGIEVMIVGTFFF